MSTCLALKCNAIFHHTFLLFLAHSETHLFIKASVTFLYTLLLLLFSRLILFNTASVSAAHEEEPFINKHPRVRCIGGPWDRSGVWAVHTFSRSPFSLKRQTDQRAIFGYSLCVTEWLKSTLNQYSVVIYDATCCIKEYICFWKVLETSDQCKVTIKE